MVGFRRAKHLKDILVREKVAPLEKNKGPYRLCCGTRCEMCKYVEATEPFRSISTQREHCFKPGSLNCHCNNVVYHFSFKTIHR